MDVIKYEERYWTRLEISQLGLIFPTNNIHQKRKNEKNPKDNIRHKPKYDQSKPNLQITFIGKISIQQKRVLLPQSFV